MKDFYLRNENGKVLCPTADGSCPYYNYSNGECKLKDNAIECDDFWFYYNEESEEEE